MYLISHHLYNQYAEPFFLNVQNILTQFYNSSPSSQKSVRNIAFRNAPCFVKDWINMSFFQLIILKIGPFLLAWWNQLQIWLHNGFLIHLGNILYHYFLTSCCFLYLRNCLILYQGILFCGSSNFLRQEQPMQILVFMLCKPKFYFLLGPCYNICYLYSIVL